MNRNGVDRLEHASEMARLLEDVAEARSRIARQRGEAESNNPPEHDARRDLLAALEPHASAVTASGHPLPYRLRDGLLLYRRLSGRPGR